MSDSNEEQKISSSFTGFGDMASTPSQRQFGTELEREQEPPPYFALGGSTTTPTRFSDPGKARGYTSIFDRSESGSRSAIQAPSATFGEMRIEERTSGLSEERSSPSYRRSSNLFGPGSGTYTDSSLSFKSSLKSSNTTSAIVKTEYSEPIKTEPKEEKDLDDVPDSESKTSEPKYKLFCTPVGGLAPDYCLKYKGSGQNFCLLRNCTTSHSGNRSFSPKPNHGYVLKVPSSKVLSAIDSPAIDLDRLESGFKHEVMTESKTLDDWNKIATNSKTQVSFGPFSKSDYKVSKSTTERYKEWQSPMLSSRKSIKSRSKLRNLNVPDFVPQTPFPEELELTELSILVQELDGNVIRIKEFLQEFNDMFKEDHENLEGLAKSTAIKFDDLVMQVGDRPKFSDPEFDVPHLWAGYTTIVQALKNHTSVMQNNIGHLVKQQEERLKFDLDAAIKKMEEQLGQIKTESSRLATLEKKVLVVDKIEEQMKTIVLPRVSDIENIAKDMHSFFFPKMNHFGLQANDLHQRLSCHESFQSQAVEHIKNHNTRLQNLEKDLSSVQSTISLSRQTHAGGFSQHHMGNSMGGPFQSHTNLYGHSAGAGGTTWNGTSTNSVGNSWNGGSGGTTAATWNGGFNTLAQSAQNSYGGSGDLLTRFAKMESVLSGLTADKDSKYIRFGNLNIRSLKECEAWLDSNHGGPDFGYIIDFHAAMEHIMQQLGRTEILTHMHNTYRLNIKDLNQAYMVQSFERKVPKFMSDKVGHKSVELKESHLSSLSSWDAWDKPEDGIKAVLEQELSAFCSSFRNTLSDKLSYDWPLMYSIATQALSATENFIITLIAFVEETYKLYSNAHYSPEHAWHITTMLLKSLIGKLAEPRIGVALSFEKNDIKKVKALTVFACLQCIDIMEDLRAAKLKNDTDAAMDLIRFVSRNPESYKMVNIEKKYTELEGQHKDLKRKYEDLSKKYGELKAGGGSSDEKLKQVVNDLKSQVNNFNKRLKTLEKKE